jgi:hypothetical protein
VHDVDQPLVVWRALRISREVAKIPACREQRGDARESSRSRGRSSRLQGSRSSESGRCCRWPWHG